MKYLKRHLLPLLFYIVLQTYNMLKFRYTFILCWLVITTNAQFKPEVKSYNEYINKAKICFVKKDYSGAVKNYETAIKYCTPQKQDISVAAYWYELAKDTIKAEETFIESILSGCENNERNYPEFLTADKNSERFAQFVKKTNTIVKEFNRRIDVPFSLLVKTLYTKDQYIRDDAFLDNKDSIIKKFAWDYMYTTDTTNMRQLVSYMQEYGAPNADKLSDDVLTNFKMIVHHNIATPKQSELKEELRRIITQAIYDGKLPSSFLYNALDYEQVLLGKKELYGTYYRYTADKKITYPNLLDIKSIDKRREGWLLLPLYWSMRYNFDGRYQLPEGYVYNED